MDGEPVPVAAVSAVGIGAVLTLESSAGDKRSGEQRRRRRRGVNCPD